MSESLIGSGIGLILDHISYIGFSLWTRFDNPPGNKHVVASPAVQILPDHVDSDSYCAVCTNAFTLESEARKMHCKHIYHSDYISPSLDLQNSCPVCWHELPSNETKGVPGRSEAVGLSIWRLAGSGFAVGRFTGGAVGEMSAVMSTPETEWGPWFTPPRSGGMRRFLGSIFKMVRRNSRKDSSAESRIGGRINMTEVPLIKPDDV